MTQPDRIHLRDYLVEAEIGAFQTERGLRQRLRFDVTAELAQPVSGADDQVDDILSYDVLTGAVATALADRRYDLLETLAERIAAEVLAHPRAARLHVTVEKLDRVPGALGVSITRDAGQVAATAGAGAGAMSGPAAVLFHGADAALPPGAVIVVPDAPGLPLPAGGDARRIALLALDQAAWALAGRLGLIVADSRTELDWAVSEGRGAVWAPARMTADIAGLPADPVALTLWLAARMGAGRVDWALPAGTPLPQPPAGFAIPMARAGG